jgi:hypothetical protein
MFKGVEIMEIKTTEWVKVDDEIVRSWELRDKIFNILHKYHNDEINYNQFRGRLQRYLTDFRNELSQSKDKLPDGWKPLSQLSQSNPDDKKVDLNEGLHHSTKVSSITSGNDTLKKALIKDKETTKHWNI